MMSAMSLSANSTEKYKKYDNWTPYSGTMTQKSAGYSQNWEKAAKIRQNTLQCTSNCMVIRPEMFIICIYMYRD